MRACDAQEQASEAESDEAQGVQQAELMRWYMDEQAQRGLLESEEEAEQEMGLLFKVRSLTSDMCCAAGCKAMCAVEAGTVGRA